MDVTFDQRVDGDRSAAAPRTANRYSTAPAAIAPAIDVSCRRVAPATIASAMTMAVDGMRGPNGTTNVAGWTMPA
jgi:hypothetical protein